MKKACSHRFRSLTDDVYFGDFGWRHISVVPGNGFGYPCVTTISGWVVSVLESKHRILQLVLVSFI